MRNLKKILALALVFAMAFTFTAGAADFTDAAEINKDYVDDVNMLVELNVIAGYPDGSFGPQKNITRAEFAKMAYTLKYGADKDGELFAAQKSAFTDVEGNSNVAWAKGYINYCANQKIVSGVGNNKFNPQGNITVAEATKMILVVLGCDATKEGFTGANWAANVVAKAIDLKVFDGWTGDPTALATRELVAKLMRNAIFAPVYEYSAITGTGSQKLAIPDETGNIYNELLGEKTMGLKFLTGIVVANENYYISKDADGEEIGVGGTTRKDEAEIYYVYRNENGEELERYLRVPVAVEDNLLGSEVSVLFRADETADNWYKNVELIGNIMVTSDTVTYEVPAVEISLYPDGESNSTAAVAPYISFNYEGEEIKVMDVKKTGKVAKCVDIQTDEDGAEALEFFGNLAWVSNVALRGEEAPVLSSDAVQGELFFEDMGKPLASKYRFVSVDGGKTFSYIFKMVTDAAEDTNFDFGAVTNYSEAKGTMTISNLGRVDLENAIVEGEIEADDYVAYFIENDKLNIVKVEAITGEVEALNDDGSAVIGGETYYLWENTDIDGNETLSDYFAENPSAISEGTIYYVYNGLVLELEAAEDTSSAEDYAVILRSTYDADLDVAYATLAFADNTQGTYEIGKLNVEVRNKPYDEKNDQPSDFEDNAYFGMVVKFKVMDNGKLDLSANDFRKITAVQDDEDGTFAGCTTYYHGFEGFGADRFPAGDVAAADVTAYEGVIDFGNGTRVYAYSDSSILFVISGNPQYDDEGVVTRDDTYAPVKAVAYKLANKKDQPAGDIASMWINGASVDAFAVSYALNSSKSMNSGVVAAAMTIGTEDADTGDAADGDALAFIVDTKVKYNVTEQGRYLQMTLIGDDGLFTANTVVGAPNFANQDANLNDDLVLGSLYVKENGDENVGELEAFLPMNFVAYALNADGEITNVEPAMEIAPEVEFDPETGVAIEGLYLVNAVSERNGSLFFINTTEVVEDDAEAVKIAPKASVKFAEKGYDVIAIDGDDYVGTKILKIAARTDDLYYGVGNAVIQVNDDGEIVRVFSFTEDYAI